MKPRPDPVPEIPLLAPEIMAEVTALADESEAILDRNPRAPAKSFAHLDERRRALLSHHLGREIGPTGEKIHCFGDSNTMFFGGVERLKFIRYRKVGLFRPRWINRDLDILPLFRTYHVGPTTAWKIGEYKSTNRAREKIEHILKKEVPAPARILLSCGEIDCRIHMARTILAGAPLEATVKKTIDKFIRFPLWLREQGYTPIIWSPPQIVPKDERYNSPTFPFIGPLEHRRDIMIEYTRQVEERCELEGIACASILGHYHPIMERIPTHFFHDNAHLSQKLMPLTLRQLEEAGALPDWCSPKG